MKWVKTVVKIIHSWELQSILNTRSSRSRDHKQVSQLIHIRQNIRHCRTLRVITVNHQYRFRTILMHRNLLFQLHQRPHHSHNQHCIRCQRTFCLLTMARFFTKNQSVQEILQRLIKESYMPHSRTMNHSLEIQGDLQLMCSLRA